MQLSIRMKQPMLRINEFDFRGSTNDGPGVRNIIFLQGCDLHCPGCHNPATWNTYGGELMSIPEIVSLIDKNTPLKKITISGGEPLLQPVGLLELSRKLYEKGYDIAVYTGRTMQDVPPELLKIINYIKVGSFKQELKTFTKAYVGSLNQEFIKLR